MNLLLTIAFVLFMIYIDLEPASQHRVKLAILDGIDFLGNMLFLLMLFYSVFIIPLALISSILIWMFM